MSKVVEIQNVDSPDKQSNMNRQGTRIKKSDDNAFMNYPGLDSSLLVIWLRFNQGLWIDDHPDLKEEPWAKIRQGLNSAWTIDKRS